MQNRFDTPTFQSCMRILPLMLITLAGVFYGVPVSAGLPPATEVVPPGFKVTAEQNLGGMMIIKAMKPNDNFPNHHMDVGISLECTWRQSPMPAQIVEIMAQAQDGPTDTSGGLRDESCGKSRHQGGALSCRKITNPPDVGGGPELVTYNIGWVGATSNGVISVSISHVYGDRGTAIGWLDAIIQKIMAEE